MSVRVWVSSVCVTLVFVMLLPCASVGASSTYGWDIAATIDDCESGGAWWPAIASDEDGNAIAVWQQDNGPYTTIWSNRYVFGVGWTEPVQVSNNTLENARMPQVDMDGNGNAIVVWAQGDVYLSVIFANRYVRGIGWEGPENVSSGPIGYAGYCDIACDSYGNAFAAWIEGSRISASRYTLGQGWGAQAIVGPDHYHNAQPPSIGVNDQGNAIVVWADNTSETYNIWSNRYTLASGWGTQVIIQTDSSGWAMDPEVAIDEMGNAIAVWRQYDEPTPGGPMHAWANRYSAGIGWGAARLLETDTTHFAGEPKIGMDGSGNAIVVWSLTATNDWTGLWTTRYSVASGWSAVEWIPETNGVEPDLAVDDYGQAIVVWRLGSVYSNTYSPSFGWGNKESVSSTLNGAQDPVVSIDRDGDAVAVWMETDETFVSVYANQYVCPPPTIVLESPEEGQTTDQPVIWVSGTTEPYATVDIDGVLVAVGFADGSFGANAPLQYGQNQIVVTATLDGRSSTVIVNVTCTNPVPGLEDELNHMMDELNETKDELNETRNELNATKDELNATQIDLDATEEELSSANDDLSDVRSQNLLLMVALSAFAILAAVMSVMFFSLRKKIADITNKSVEAEGPPPPQS